MRKPGQQILKSSQRHLGLRLFGSRVLRENLDDHTGAIKCGFTNRLFQVPQLVGRELDVKDDCVGIMPRDSGFDFINFSCAHVSGWIDFANRCDHPIHGSDPERGKQAIQLIEGLRIQARTNHAQTPIREGTIGLALNYWKQGVICF